MNEVLKYMAQSKCTFIIMFAKIVFKKSIMLIMLTPAYEFELTPAVCMFSLLNMQSLGFPTNFNQQLFLECINCLLRLIHVSFFKSNNAHF